MPWVGLAAFCFFSEHRRTPLEPSVVLFPKRTKRGRSARLNESPVCFTKVRVNNPPEKQINALLLFLEKRRTPLDQGIVFFPKRTKRGRSARLNEGPALLDEGLGQQPFCEAE
jgi:hypothetical protein